MYTFVVVESTFLPVLYTMLRESAQMRWCGASSVQPRLSPLQVKSSRIDAAV
ncbi:MAG: hypothetical protein ACP5I3_12680 [Thermoproteus sp.]